MSECKCKKCQYWEMRYNLERMMALAPRKFYFYPWWNENEREQELWLDASIRQILGYMKQVRKDFDL